MSAHLQEATQQQIERDDQDELIADFDEIHGPADPEPSPPSGPSSPAARRPVRSGRVSGALILDSEGSAEAVQRNREVHVA
ncbi:MULTISPECIES: hypothetical protein [unclassified Streptomyces]|uniref:hypothetical protein n=1 Tax=unclassified Streptomyces TaxID=2593676 RepID=UPI0035DDEFF6